MKLFRYAGIALLVGLLAGCNARTPQSTTLQASGQTTNGTITELDAGKFVPGNFTLTDQDGKKVPIYDATTPITVVDFLYTHCTDTCPFLAVKLRALSQLLGDKASEVRIVLVSTDPERDTPKVLADYTKAFGMEGKWFYLTGSAAEVAAVWKAYHVTVAKESKEDEDETNKNAQELGLTTPEKTGPSPQDGLTKDENDFGNQIAMKFGGGYDVTHTTSFLVLDKNGSVRSIVEAETSPKDLTSEIVKGLNG